MRYRAVEIKLESAPCDATCPIYTMLIAGDGNVHWRGTNWVKVVGERALQIAPAEVEALVGELDRTHFFERYEFGGQLPSPDNGCVMQGTRTTCPSPERDCFEGTRLIITVVRDRETF